MYLLLLYHSSLIFFITNASMIIASIKSVTIGPFFLYKRFTYHSFLCHQLYYTTDIKNKNKTKHTVTFLCIKNLSNLLYLELVIYQ